MFVHKMRILFSFKRTEQAIGPRGYGARLCAGGYDTDVLDCEVNADYMAICFMFFKPYLLESKGNSSFRC